MNDQNKQQQIPLSEEVQDLEEVTGGMQPAPPKGIYPFDSGTAPTTPAAEKVLIFHQGARTTPEKLGATLDTLNKMALDGRVAKANIKKPIGK
jgi:hypothetical protein